MIDSFALWLNRTPLSVEIQMTHWAIPALQTIHILGVAFVLTASLMINLRVLGVAGKHQSLPDMIVRYSPWIWKGAVVLVVSGVLLGMAQALDVVPNLMFQIKMVLLAGALITTYLAGQTRSASLRSGDGAFAHAPGGAIALSGKARILSVISLLLWIAIAIAGRWIAYI